MLDTQDTQWNARNFNWMMKCNRRWTRSEREDHANWSQVIGEWSIIHLIGLNLSNFYRISMENLQKIHMLADSRIDYWVQFDAVDRRRGRRKKNGRKIRFQNNFSLILEFRHSELRMSSEKKTEATGENNNARPPNRYSHSSIIQQTTHIFRSTIKITGFVFVFFLLDSFSHRT